MRRDGTFEDGFSDAFEFGAEVGVHEVGVVVEGHDLVDELGVVGHQPAALVEGEHVLRAHALEEQVVQILDQGFLVVHAVQRHHVAPLHEARQLDHRLFARRLRAHQDRVSRLHSNYSLNALYVFDHSFSEG